MMVQLYTVYTVVVCGFSYACVVGLMPCSLYAGQFKTRIGIQHCLDVREHFGIASTVLNSVALLFGDLRRHPHFSVQMPKEKKITFDELSNAMVYKFQEPCHLDD